MLKNFKRESTVEKKQLTTSAGIPVGDNQNSLTAGPRGHSLCRIGSCLFLNGLVPFSGHSVPARVGETPPSRSSRNRAYWPGAGGLPAWRKGSLRDPEKQIAITNWTD